MFRTAVSVQVRPRDFIKFLCCKLAPSTTQGLANYTLSEPAITSKVPHASRNISDELSCLSCTKYPNKVLHCYILLIHLQTYPAAVKSAAVEESRKIHVFTKLSLNDLILPPPAPAFSYEDTEVTVWV